MSRKGRVLMQTEVLWSGCWPALGLTPMPAAPPIHAALSDDSDPPVIQSLERGATVATLRFRKPAAMSDQDDLVYRAQVGRALMSCVLSLPLALCRSPNSARCTLPTVHAHAEALHCSSVNATNVLAPACCSCTTHLPTPPPSLATLWCSTSPAALAQLAARMWPPLDPSPSRCASQLLCKQRVAQAVCPPPCRRSLPPSWLVSGQCK